MTRKSVRDIRTVAGLGDKRRKRTVHGAFMELGALAMQKERLLKEREAAKDRIADIDDRIREMDRQSAILLGATGGPVTKGEESSPIRVVDKDRARVPTLCEKDLGY